MNRCTTEDPQIELWDFTATPGWLPTTSDPGIAPWSMAGLTPSTVTLCTARLAAPGGKGGASDPRDDLRGDQGLQLGDNRLGG